MPNDLAPHSAILQIHWEVHEQMPNGMFYGVPKDTGMKVCELRGQDRSLANYHLAKLLELIEENSTHANRFGGDDAGRSNSGEGGGVSQGLQGSISPPPKVQPMCGTFA